MAAEVGAGLAAGVAVEAGPVVAAGVAAGEVGLPLAGPGLEADVGLGVGSLFEGGDLGDGDLQRALTDSFSAFLAEDDCGRWDGCLGVPGQGFG